MKYKYQFLFHIILGVTVKKYSNEKLNKASVQKFLSKDLSKEKFCTLAETYLNVCDFFTTIIIHAFLNINKEFKGFAFFGVGFAVGNCVFKNLMR